jgi:hypothetical protein
MIGCPPSRGFAARPPQIAALRAAQGGSSILDLQWWSSPPQPPSPYGKRGERSRGERSRARQRAVTSFVCDAVGVSPLLPKGEGDRGGEDPIWVREGEALISGLQKRVFPPLSGEAAIWGGRRAKRAEGGQP